METEDFLFVEDLRVEANIGVSPVERENSQTLLLSFKIYTDLDPAAASGEVEDTVDYYRLSRWLSEFVGNGEWKLLETLGERLCERCLEEFDVEKISLKLRKPEAIDQAASAGLRLTRTSEDY